MQAHFTTDVLIIGAGQAGGHLAVHLRKAGFQGSILLVGEEPSPPYERPPLSKAYLHGQARPDQVVLHDAAALAREAIGFEAGRRVSALDPAGATARLAGGETVRFGWCVLATGARPRSLDAPGAALLGVTSLRTIEDAERIREAFAADACRLVVVGGGYIGLETAAAARDLGHDVTVIESRPRLLGRVTSPIMSDYVRRLHEGRGVDVRLSAQVAALEGDCRIKAVRLACGERLAADLVVVGVGVEPEARLAEAAGLACDGGVLVDDRGRTSAPNVLAIGDCACWPIPGADGRRRLESVQHAMTSAEVAAGVVLGQPRPYLETPTFWSDQYEIRLQSVGLMAATDEPVVRGDMAADRFSIAYLRDGRMTALDAVNTPRDVMAARKLIQAGVVLDRSRLADPAIPLKSLQEEPAGR